MTIKELREAISNLPDDLLVCIDESCAEATGYANSTKVVRAEDCPYDKGDNLLRTGKRDGVTPDTKLFIISTW